MEKNNGCITYRKLTLILLTAIVGSGGLGWGVSKANETSLETRVRTLETNYAVILEKITNMNQSLSKDVCNLQTDVTKLLDKIEKIGATK